MNYYKQLFKINNKVLFKFMFVIINLIIFAGCLLQIAIFKDKLSNSEKPSDKANGMENPIDLKFRFKSRDFKFQVLFFWITLPRNYTYIFYSKNGP